MVTKELLDYISSESKRGIAKDTIRNMLIQNGWEAKDVDEAERTIFPHTFTSQETISPISPIAQQPQKTTTIPEMVVAHNEKANLLNALQKYNQEKTEHIVQAPVQSITQPVATQINMAAELADMQKYTEPKKSGFKKVLVLIVVLLFLLSGATAYGYYAGYFVSLSKVSAEAFSNIRNTKTGSFDASIVVDNSNTDQNNNTLSMISGLDSKITFSASGSYDISKKDMTLFTGNMSISSGALSLRTEDRLVPGTLFIRATEVPVLSFFDMSSYKNQWLSFPTDGSAEANNIPFITSSANNISVIASLSDEQKAYIANMVADSKVATISKRLSSEVMDGITMYHFAFDINKDNTVQLISDIQSYVHNPLFDADSIKDSLRNVSTISGEAWVGKNDHMLYKVTMNLGNMSGQITFKDLHDAVKVDTPDDYVPFSAFFQTSLKVSQDKNTDADTHSVLGNAQLDASTFATAHTGSFIGFCKTLTATGVTCRDSAKAYVVFAPLIATANTFACADSTGAKADLPKAPTSFVCK